MASIRFHWSILLSLFLYSIAGFSAASSLSSNVTDGYEFSLIHRDSKDSPFKQNWTTAEQFQYELIRGRTRSHYFYNRITKKTSEKLYPTSSETISVKNGIQTYGEYLLKMYISNRRQVQWLTYDTGSDLVWVQCKQCKPCYKQPNKPFDISKSKTGYIFPCSKCDIPQFRDLSTSCSNKKCSFNYAYEDQSKLSGFLGKESFSLGVKSKSYKSIIFGCATQTVKMEGDPDGLAGFAIGPTSLPNQLSRYLGRNAFASCLVRNWLNKENKLIMGSKAVSFKGISYTPIVTPPGSTEGTSFFNLEVRGIKVNNKALKVSLSAFNSGSGTLIDSGTTFIYLKKAALNPILKEIKRKVKSKLTATNIEGFLLCYKLKLTEQLQLNKHFPSVTFTFKGNAQVRLKAYQYMIIYDESTVCSVFSYTGDEGTNLLGSFFQQNYLVVHDIQTKRVGFKLMSCMNFKPL